MSDKQFILGIDPGYGGALALTNGVDILLRDMPIRMRKNKKEIDI